MDVVLGFTPLQGDHGGSATHPGTPNFVAVGVERFHV